MMFQVSSLLAVSLGWLVSYGVHAGFSCKTSEQIHWIGSTGKRHKCLECPDCFAGLQPSVPCGSTVAYGTPVHCVSCKLGETYSDNNGNAQCKSCTVCSQGKAIKQNCTLVSNTVCDNSCIEGYYLEPFIFQCFPCVECCGDEKDEPANECANSAKKCKARSVPCAKKPTKASEATTSGRKRPSSVNKTQSDTSTALRTTHTTRKGHKNRTTWTVKYHTDHLPTSSGPSVLSDDRRPVIDGRASGNKSGESESGNKVLIIVSSVMAVTTVLSLFFVFFCVMRRGQPIYVPANTGAGEPVSPIAAPSPQETQENPGDLSLEQLEKEHQDVFDWMCLKLDSGKWCGFRKDYERLAAKYDKILLEERNALHGELERSGSPSKMLMSLLQAKYPNLTLKDFVKTLKEIGRNDVAEKLLLRLKNNT